MRKADVYLFNEHVGLLEEREPRGFRFTYAADYRAKEGAIPLMPLMPLRDEPYESDALFPFFDGLIPEGWLLDIAERTWKINPRDRFSCLLACCRDCIGAASIREVVE
ncbi:MAG: HipA N-terminal domain-containing protein [bacterium]|nr:HipA N-terminal domain-containing protein [bacterium]